MPFFAVIAICLNSTPVEKCREATSVHWVTIAEPSNGLAGCMRAGMTAAVRSRLLRGGDYPKIFCRPAAAETDAVASRKR